MDGAARMGVREGVEQLLEEVGGGLPVEVVRTVGEGSAREELEGGPQVRDPVEGDGPRVDQALDAGVVERGMSGDPGHGGGQIAADGRMRDLQRGLERAVGVGGPPHGHLAAPPDGLVQVPVADSVGHHAGSVRARCGKRIAVGAR
ncbi:MAG: hypothetical protein R3F61_34770 [Myxococcota bacterium]